MAATNKTAEPISPILVRLQEEADDEDELGVLDIDSSFLKLAAEFDGQSPELH
jgi:hypothetical protein